MTTYTIGEQGLLSVEWHTYSGGPLTTVAGVSITIAPAAGGAPVIGPTSTGVVNPSTGVNTYAWTPSVAAGDYLVTWSGTDVSANTTTATELVTVVESTTMDRLATVQQLANKLQVDVSELHQAGALVAIEAATAVVQSACGQRLVEVVDDTVTLTAGMGGHLRLPQRPVTAVSSVTLDGSAVALGTASGTYRLLGDQLWRDIGWMADPYTPATAVVVYSHGRPLGHSELQLATTSTLSLAAAAYGNPDPSIAREQVDDYSVQYDRAAAALDASPSLRAALRRQYGRRAGLVRVA